MAISDSGATAHFLLENAAVVNKRRAIQPLSIKLPDGTIIKSSHTCNLDIPWLPKQMTEAHIVPGLSHSSLISTRKFCDAGCKVVFEQHECRVTYKGRVVLVGAHSLTTGLWHLPINLTTSDEAPAMDLQLLPNQQIPQRVERAANMHTLPHKQQQLKYMHQSFLCPPNASLVKAINNEQLKGIPIMSADNVQKFLLKSPATAKGGMKRVRSNIRSTRPKTNKRKGARRGN
jgi:hypothetical protein